MTQSQAQFEVEAVLCEDGRTVALYHYHGDELVHLAYQSLPMPVSEEAFEGVRREWEEAFCGDPTGGAYRC